MTSRTTWTAKAGHDPHGHGLGADRTQPYGAGRAPGQRPDDGDHRQPQQSRRHLPGHRGWRVWRTRDGGDHWTPIFDRQLSLGIGEPGAIAIDPTDTSIIYVGTSSRVTPQARPGSSSTDGGASCIRVGSGFPADNVGNASQFFNQEINEIIVDPATPTTLYLAASTGVYFSTDSGAELDLRH